MPKGASISPTKKWGRENGKRRTGGKLARGTCREFSDHFKTGGKMRKKKK